jgi:hypothetical protein
MSGWTWWCKPIIPALVGLRQEDGKCKTSLGYIARAYFKQTK